MALKDTKRIMLDDDELEPVSSGNVGINVILYTVSKPHNIKQSPSPGKPGAGETVFAA